MLQGQRQTLLLWQVKIGSEGDWNRYTELPPFFSCVGFLWLLSVPLGFCFLFVLLADCNVQLFVETVKKGST